MRMDSAAPDALDMDRTDALDTSLITDELERSRERDAQEGIFWSARSI